MRCISTLVLLLIQLFGWSVAHGEAVESSREASATPDFESLKRGFQQPSGHERVRVEYAIPRGGWDVDALIEDLEAMKRFKVGGLAYVDGYEGHGQVFGDRSHFLKADRQAEKFVSDEHIAKLNRFLEEAHRRDIQILAPIRAMYMSGGPWIEQKNALKDYTLSKTYVTGPGKIRMELPTPSHRDADAIEPDKRKKYYRDVCVLSWPVAADPRQTLMHRKKPNVSVSHAESHLAREFLVDGNPITSMPIYGAWLLAFGPQPDTPIKETAITYEFPEEVTMDACFVKLAPDKVMVPVRGTITCSEDGKSYRKVSAFEVRIGEEKRIAFDKPEKVRWFRVTFPPLTNRDTVGIAEIEFLASNEQPVTRERISHFNFKAARACSNQSLSTKEDDQFEAKVFYDALQHSANDDLSRDQFPTGQGGAGGETIGHLTDGHIIRVDEVQDLTSRMNEAGVLEWDVPMGTWCVMRFGYTVSKHSYVNARNGGSGYECDLYNPDAARIQYENVPRRILERLGQEGKKGLQGFWFESFEAGPTNWSTGLSDEFHQLAGYDVTPWLPVLADELVEGVEQTDAFLTDFRSTLHTMFAKNHHGVMKALCERDGLQWLSQTGGSKQSNQNELFYLRQTHIPGGEFWSGQPVIGFDNVVAELSGNGAVHGESTWWTLDSQTKLPASVSHTYGNSPIVTQEALIGSDFDFHRVPAFDKHVADRAFCTGGNQFCVGIWPHDARKDVLPGLHHWGWINPRNPVFRQSESFFQYVSRCQSMLQKGIFQADVLIAIEGAMYLRERTAHQSWPKVFVPKGYDFDFISRELLLNDLNVKNAALELSSGMRYRVLQIPDFANRMSCAAMRKIEKLLNDGAVIAAPKPIAGLTGRDYQDGLGQHRELANRIWSGLDGITITRKEFGRGRLYWGASLEEVLKAENMRPDFSYESIEEAAFVDHIHRKIEAHHMDIYFLANASKQTAKIRARFRGQGKRIPHRFDPLSGQVRRIVHYSPRGDDLEVPLHLEAVASTFVVFTEGTDLVRIDSVVVSSNEVGSAGTQGVGLHRTLPVGFEMSNDGRSITAELPANGIYQLRSGNNRDVEFTVTSVPEPIVLKGPWRIDFNGMFNETFERQLNELRSFHLMEDERLRYFSGEAKYHHPFSLKEGAIKNAKLYLDCGEVRWLAVIYVNGKRAGDMWAPPWRLDITPYCQTGENKLDIVCVNPWKNRMIGESQLSDGERKATINNFRMKISEFQDMKLMEAGILGPVKIVSTVRREIEF